MESYKDDVPGDKSCSDGLRYSETLKLKTVAKERERGRERKMKRMGGREKQRDEGGEE